MECRPEPPRPGFVLLRVVESGIEERPRQVIMRWPSPISAPFIGGGICDHRVAAVDFGAGLDPVAHSGDRIGCRDTDRYRVALESCVVN